MACGLLRYLSAIQGRIFDMYNKKSESTQVSRRSALKLAASASFAMAAGGIGRPANAADVTLSVWTGLPELAPWYEAAGAAFTKATGTKVTVLSTTLREDEQKLAAA